MKEKTVYALGFFDGVHLGHQALLTACRQLAAEQDLRAGVVTFTSHPDSLVSGTTPQLINTTEDRRTLLQSYGIGEILELPFNRELMQMPWRDFIRMLRMAPYHAAGFVCGSDFRFGFKGEGTAQILQEYCNAAGMPCAIVSQQTLEDTRISSTHIRSLLEQGKMEEAVRFLGHPHILTGQVVTGRKLGRTIGIPTANLLIPEGIAIPKFGVYACKALTPLGEYLAVTNVGNRPTVGGHRVTVEPWLLDFEGDLYGRTLTLEFYKFLRPEVKFSSLDALRQEILKNAGETREFFQKT